MRRLRRILPLLAVLLAAPPVSMAEQPAAQEPSEASRELIAHEKLRSSIESVVADLARGTIGFGVARQRLAALGPPAVPFLQAEMIGPGKAPTYLLMATALGDMKTPESLRALRELVARADQATGPVRFKKKTWSCYGLAVAGEVEAVDLLNSGQLKAAANPFCEGTSALELVGALTAPASLPRLFEQAQAYEKDQELEPQLVAVLDTLGRIADPATLPRLLPYLSHASPEVRRSAARAVGRLGDLAGAAALVTLLADPSEITRGAAAQALLDLKPAGRSADIRARLDVETDEAVRTHLYRVLGAIADEAAIEPLRGYYNLPGREADRRFIVDVLGSIGSTKGYPLLRTALNEPDVSLAIHAAHSLGMIGGAGAMETLLARVSDSRWPLAEGVIRFLAAEKETRAGSRIADRMLKEYLASPLTNVEKWDDLYIMGDALADLRYVEPLPAIREAIKLQSDPTIVRYLEGLVRRLTAILDNQADVKKWISAAGSEEQAIRRLAYSRLGEIGGDEAAKGLAEAFPAATSDDQREMLRALGATRSQTAAPLIERVLLDGAFDPNEAQPRPLRPTAAYAARRLGGPRMVDALRKSAERREGQDIEVLTYLAVMAGKEALPSLKAVRIRRLRHPSTELGNQQVRVDWMIRELTAGRSVKSLDVPPEQLPEE